MAEITHAGTTLSVDRSHSSGRGLAAYPSDPKAALRKVQAAVTGLIADEDQLTRVEWKIELKAKAERSMTRNPTSQARIVLSPRVTASIW